MGGPGKDLPPFQGPALQGQGEAQVSRVGAVPAVEDHALHPLPPGGRVHGLHKTQLPRAGPVQESLVHTEVGRRGGELPEGIAVHPQGPAGGLRQQVLPQQAVLALPPVVEQHPAPVVNADGGDHAFPNTLVQNRMRIVAACARVALPPGTSWPSMPLISPALTAQDMASTA